MTHFDQDNTYSIDFKAILFQLIRNWHLLVISLFVFIVIAKLYIRYSIPVYKVSTTLMIKDDKKANGVDEFLEGMELLRTGKNLLNEQVVLQSFSSVQKTINNIDNFKVSYFIEGTVKSGELYKKSPFIVKSDSLFAHSYDTPLYIKFKSDSTFTIYEKEEQSTVQKIFNNSAKIIFEIDGKVGVPCISDRFYVTIFLSPEIGGKISQKTNYFFIINDIEKLAKSYRSHLEVIKGEKGSSILYLTTTGLIPEKEKDFLNTHCETYIQSGLEEKNRIAQNTITFIEKYLLEITDSLAGTENELEKYRTNQQLMDVGSASSALMNQLAELEKERAMLLVKDKYYKYLQAYVKNNYNVENLTIPSSMGIEDPLLNELVQELYALYAEQHALSFSAKEKNPTYQALEIKIQSARKAISESLNSIIVASNIALQANEDRYNLLKKQFSSLPNKERNLITIQRRFNLNDHIYNYLMERKIEAGIAKAANTPDNKIIDVAALFGRNPVSPYSLVIYLIAIFLGFFIPSLYLFLKNYLNDTVTTKDWLQKSIQLPLLGVISHYVGKDFFPALYKTKSPFAESLRSLRINLQYLAADSKNKVVGITSTVSGEGKTFFSSNLAVSLTQSGFKVLLIGADLRKPRLHVNLEMTQHADIGLSSFLINKSSVTDILHKEVYPSLDVIFAGAIPPNPSELLQHVRMQELISELKPKYDYIILDGTPLGPVADYYLLKSFIDINLFVVRHGFTKRVMAKEIKPEFIDNKLDHTFIVYNDFKVENTYGGYYNTYGGTGYGYYENVNEQKSVFQKVMNIFNRIKA